MRPFHILAVLVFWFVIGMLYLTSAYWDNQLLAEPRPFTTAFILTTLFSFGVWGIITWVLMWLLKKPIHFNQIGRIVLLFCFGLMACQPIVTAIDHSAFHLLKGSPLPSLSAMMAATSYVSFFNNLVMYVLVFLICFGFNYQQHAQQSQTQALQLAHQHTETQLALSDMQLHALQSQLSPHFLFNCLNAISGLARSGNPNAVTDATAKLGDLLRYAVNASQQHWVNWGEEIAFTQNYIRLQQLRFPHQFAYEIETDTGIEQHPCPPFVLQTLVENAINHTESNQAHSQAITIRLRQQDKHILITVDNPMPSHPPSDSKGLGIGLENLKQRLRILYQSQHIMNLTQRDGRFQVCITTPLEPAHV